MNFLFPVLLFFDLVILKIVWKSDVEDRQIFVLKKILLVLKCFSLKRLEPGIPSPPPPIYLVLL